MGKKKKYVFAGVVSLMIIGVAGLGYLYFNDSKSEKKLETGIYALDSYGCLYYDNQEDIAFDLLLYFYNSEDENDCELLRKYSDFELVTDTGSKIPFSIEDSIEGFVKSDDEKIFQNNITINISDSYLVENELRITGLGYTDENGKLENISLGSISIKKVNSTQDAANVLAVKYEWKRFVLPLMNTYDVEVENISENVVCVKEIDFGLNEISCNLINLQLEADEVAEYNCDVGFSDIDGYFIFYLKPLVKIDSNGEAGQIVQKNICRHRYIGSDITLYDYFLNGGINE